MSHPLHILCVTAIVCGVAMLVVAALHDIMARTVPNRMAGCVAVAGLVAQSAAMAAGTGHMGLALLAALIVFCLAALMWRQGWMGGADVKLLGASALLVPAWMVPTLVADVTLAGGLLSIIYLVARRRMPRPAPGKPYLLAARALRVERWRLRRGGPLPYAVAIAGGACFVLTHGGLLS